MIAPLPASDLDGWVLTESSRLTNEIIEVIQPRRSSTPSGCGSCSLKTWQDDMPELHKSESKSSSESVRQSSSMINSPLIAAIQHTNAEETRAELDNGAEIMAQCSDGWSALHYAAHCGVTSVLKINLESKRYKDINAADSSLQTPLHIAALMGWDGIGALLLDYGADINAKNKRERTPLYVALSGNKGDFVEMLIKRGASVERDRLSKRLKNRLEEIEITMKWKMNEASQRKKKKEMKTSKPRNGLRLSSRK